MLRVCSINNSILHFSVTSDTDVNEFVAMSGRPLSGAQKRLFEKAKRDNDVFLVRPFELPAVLFLTDSKATLSGSELSFLQKMLAEFPVLVTAETDPAAVQQMLNETHIDTIVAASGAPQDLKDALNACGIEIPILRIF